LKLHFDREESRPLVDNTQNTNLTIKTDMNICMIGKISILFLAVGGWFICLSLAQASADPFLDGQMKLVESQIKHCQKMSYFLESLTLAVFTCGIAVGLFQSGAPRGKTIAAGMLGLLSSVIVGVTHTFFHADDRAYGKVAQQANMKLNSFKRQLALYRVLDEETKTGLRNQFSHLENEIDQLEYTTLPSAASIANRSAAVFLQGSILIPEAWAGQGTETTIQAPAWATKLPVDEYNLYYSGVAEGKTFQEAHDKALLDARTSAVIAFVKEAAALTQLAGKADLIEELAKALGSSADVAETFVAPNRGGGFRGYVLLRLSRSAAAFMARSVFVKTGAPYDAKFLDVIKKEAK
jgi:hypothetical protein